MPLSHYWNEDGLGHCCRSICIHSEISPQRPVPIFHVASHIESDPILFLSFQIGIDFVIESKNCLPPPPAVSVQLWLHCVFTSREEWAQVERFSPTILPLFVVGDSSTVSEIRQRLPGIPMTPVPVRKSNQTLQVILLIDTSRAGRAGQSAGRSSPVHNSRLIMSIYSITLRWRVDYFPSASKPKQYFDLDLYFTIDKNEENSHC